MTIRNFMIRIFMALALLGFLLSAAVHGLALAGITPPLARPQMVFALHAGIFVVFVPAVLVSRRFAGSRVPAGMRDILRRSPLWIGALLVIVFLYAVVNFVLVFFLLPTPRGTPSAATDFLKMLRGFSGHWMLFYFASFAIHRAALQPDNGSSDPGIRKLEAGIG